MAPPDRRRLCFLPSYFRPLFSSSFLLLLPLVSTTAFLLPSSLPSSSSSSFSSLAQTRWQQQLQQPHRPQQPPRWTGRAGTVVFAGDDSVEIGHVDSLEGLREVIQSKGVERPLVLRFHASWCSACKKFAPSWQQTANAYNGHFDFVDVDVTGKRDIITEMGLTVLPHSHFYKAGSKIEDFGVSVKKLNALLERLDKYKDG